VTDDRESRPTDLSEFDGGGAATDVSDAAAEDAGEAGTDADATAERTGRAPVSELDREGRVELGVDLLRHLETAELPLSAVVDRVETVTTDPSLTREILDAAEKRGVLERDDARVRTRTGGTFVRFESQVVRREGEFDCRRCGAGLSTGHFVRFETGELGPFGSSCVRKVLGRED
jgi:hypothetical protein